MPPVKLFFRHVLLAGFLRLILHWNLKIALVLGVICITVNDQIKSRTRLADQRDELLPAAIGIAGVVNNS